MDCLQDNLGLGSDKEGMLHEKGGFPLSHPQNSQPQIHSLSINNRESPHETKLSPRLKRNLQYSRRALMLDAKRVGKVSVVAGEDCHIATDCRATKVQPKHQLNCLSTRYLQQRSINLEVEKTQSGSLDLRVRREILKKS